MDKKPLIVVSICVVILFLTASMNCTVSADQIRNHSVTIEITGQNTQQQRTINVSDTELQDIKDVFAEVSVLLASASSPEDKLQVYWNAICRLHDSGVLGDLSCEDAYRIVTRWYRPSISLPNHHPLKDSNNTNAFCLVSGRVNYSISSNRVSNFVNRFCDYLRIYSRLVILCYCFFSAGLYYLYQILPSSFLEPSFNISLKETQSL